MVKSDTENKIVRSLISRMTLREKIGQCVQVELSKIPLASADATAEWFARYPVGSIFMGKDLASITDGATGNADALARCRAASRFPFYLSVNLAWPTPIPANKRALRGRDPFHRSYEI